jgi:hypothetical protein
MSGTPCRRATLARYFLLASRGLAEYVTLA